jgi:hypothetical protein
MSMLDELGRQALNEGLSDKLDDNPEEDQALQTTARIATAHIWAFLAPASTLDDYGARRAAKVDEVNYICAGIAPHVASALANHVLRAFDSDFTAVWAQRQGGLVRRAQEEELGSLAGDLLSSVVEHGQSGSDGEADEPGLLSAPKVSAYRTANGLNPYPTQAPVPPLPSTNIPGSGEADPQNSEEGNIPPQARDPHHGPGLFQAPKVDQELEDPNDYYGWWGAGGQAKQKAEAHLGADVGFGSAAVPFDSLSPEEKAAHIAREHQADVRGMSALGSAALHQVLHDEAGLDVDHYHPQSDVNSFGPYQDTSTVVDRYGHLHQVPWALMDAYGHVRFGAFDPGAEDNDPDGEMAELDGRNPENDDYENPGANGNWRGGVRQRDPKNQVPDTWASQGHVSAFGHISGLHLADNEDVEHHEGYAWDDPQSPEAEQVQPPDEDTEAVSAKGQHWSAAHSAYSKVMGPRELVSQTHKSTTREAQLVRSAQKPPVAPRRAVQPEPGYAPEEVFPGVYGALEAPEIARGVVKPRTGAADLAGNAGLPANSESGTGASGDFDENNAENIMTPGGMASGNMSQSDEPQDIQAQLGQIPTLSHKIGAKVAEIAAEVLAHNPRLSAAEAMTLSLKTLRLWPRVVLSAERRVLPPLNGDDKPSYDHLTDDHGLDESKLSMGGTATTHGFEHENYDPEYFNHEHTAGLSRVAMGGADYLPEGEEVLEECPQCHREAYNRQVNRCHHCGFWDAGLEPLIEIT